MKGVIILPSEILTKDDKATIVHALRDFVIRVSSNTNERWPEEVTVLPAVAKLLIDSNHWTGLTSR